MMYFNCPVSAPNGVEVGHHFVSRGELGGDLSVFALNVDSWPTEQARIDGSGPAWAWLVEAPVSGLQLQDGLYSGLVGAVLADPRFAGGVAVPDASDTLDGAKARKRAEVLAWRWKTESGGFQIQQATFGSDHESRTRITTAAVRAQVDPKALRQWVMPDGSSQALTASDLLAVAAALDQHVEATFNTAAGLLASINAATTADELAAITLP